MSRRKQDRPQHLATANGTEDPASEMNSLQDAGGSERSTVSEAFNGQETSPGADESDTETTFQEVSFEGQMPEVNNDLEICDPEEDTLEGEDSFDSSPKSEDDDSLKCEADQNGGRRGFDFPLNPKDPKFGKHARNLAQPRNSVLQIERDSERGVGFDACGGDQPPVGESHTSGNVRRPSNTGYCAINAESHVTKLQSFVDSLAKLTEPSYAARSQPSATFLPQYPKITPTKASGGIGSYSGSSVRPGFPYFGYQPRADDQGLATTPGAFSNPLEQPLDLSTKKHAGFVSHEGRGDPTSDIASPEVRRRCFERSERLQTELFRQRPSYNDPGNRNGSSSRSVLSELEDHATSSTRSVSFSAGHLTRTPPEEKHRNSDAGRYKRERTVSSFADLSLSKAGNTYHTKSEIANYRKETKQHRSNDDSQRVVAGKRKYSTFDEGSTHGGVGGGVGEHSPGSGTIQKCQRQSTRCSGSSPAGERGEAAALQPIKEDREYMNMRCSCGTRFESLYELAIHIERSGHVPGSLRPESLADLPKLVRGQDVWMSQGPEQAELILRCVQCRTSFRSLPELTVHMIRTKHYVNIVGTDGPSSAGGQTDYGDQPSSREKESPQRGNLLRDSKTKNDAYATACTVRESERSVDMGQQRSRRNKSPRLNNEGNETSVGMRRAQDDYSGGRNQLNLRSTLSGLNSTKEISEVELSDQCKEKDVDENQLPAVALEGISEKEVVDPTTAALDESKEGSRADIGGQSLRRHSLASRLHSKISSVTGNIQERIGSNQSANSSNTTTRARCTRQGNSRSKSRALQDACRVPESVRDPGVERFSADEHSSAGGVLRIQSPVKSFEPISGRSSVNDNEGSRRNKRSGGANYETENDRAEKKSKHQSTSWKPGHHQSPKDTSRCLIGDRQPETGPSTQDLRKERMLLNVSRWIASTELETKEEYCGGGETQLEDLEDPIDNRLELVSPPSQPVETSSILVAIKNFVDSSFCGQSFAASGSHSSNRTTFPGCSSSAGRNPVPTGRNIPEMNHTLNLTAPGNECESPSWISPMKRNPHLDVAQVADPTDRRPTIPATEEELLRRIDVDYSSCKEPFAVALEVNAELNNEKDDTHEGQSVIGHTAASPLWNRKSENSDPRNIKCEERSEVQSECPQGSYCSGSETEEEGPSADPINAVFATQHAPFPQSKPSEDPPNEVEPEECSRAAQSMETISVQQQADNHGVDSTAKSPKPGSPSPGIVPNTFPLPDTDPLRDCDRKQSISKPISFFLSSRSFEKVC